MSPPTANAQPDCFDVIILGCGVSGLVAARVAAEAGQRVMVIDDYAAPGGNHISTSIGGREFDIGSIYFNSSDRQFKLFPELQAVCEERQVIVRKIDPTGTISLYPFSLRHDILRRGLAFATRAVLSALLGRWRYRHAGNTADFARQRLGSYFFEESGLRFYMQRLLGCDPDAVDLSFAQQRMKWIARATELKEVLAGVARRLRPKRSSDGGGVSLVRPAGGFTAYYDRSVQQLARRGVTFALSAGLQTIVVNDDRSLSVALDDRTVTGRRIVSTLPTSKTLALVGEPQAELGAVALLSLFVRATGRRTGDWTVLYNFQKTGSWKRITLHSMFYGEVDHSPHFTVEIPIPAGQAMQGAEAAFEAFCADVAGFDLFDGELELVGSMSLDHAYPLLTKGYAVKRDAALRTLASFQVQAIGRQGRFDYIPHSNVAATEAENRMRHPDPVSAC